MTDIRGPRGVSSRHVRSLLRFNGNSSTLRGSSTAPFLGELSKRGGKSRRMIPEKGRNAESAEPRGRGAPVMQNHSRDAKKDAASWSEVEGLLLRSTPECVGSFKWEVDCLNFHYICTIIGTHTHTRGAGLVLSESRGPYLKWQV